MHLEPNTRKHWFASLLATRARAFRVRAVPIDNSVVFHDKDGKPLVRLNTGFTARRLLTADHIRKSLVRQKSGRCWAWVVKKSYDGIQAYSVSQGRLVTLRKFTALLRDTRG